MCPVNLSSLTKDLEIHMTSTTAKTVVSLVEELIKEGAISGSLKSGTGLFMPTVFAAAQQRAAHSFYTQNSFIE